MSSQTEGQLLANNKSVHFNYHVEEQFSAGIMLEGWEVKALLARKASIENAFIHIREGELYLVNAHLTPAVNIAQHIKPDPVRSRKLLLKRREIDSLIGKVEVKGYTLVPLRVVVGSRKIKLELALAKGKKLHDKREDQKERDWKREQGQLLRQAARG